VFKYAYDPLNRLIEATNGAGDSKQYNYDPLGNRTSVMSVIATASQRGGKQSTSLHYVLDITRPYDNLLMTQGDSQNQSFIWGNSLLSATGEDNFHYLQDHLGSPIRFVNNNHSDTLSYDEFGVPEIITNTTQTQPFGFTGYQHDNISGLYYA